MWEIHEGSVTVPMATGAALGMTTQRTIWKPRRGKATRESSVKEENRRCCVLRNSTRGTWKFSRSAHTLVAAKKWLLSCFRKLGFLYSGHSYLFAFRTGFKSRSLSSKLNLKKQSKENEVFVRLPMHVVSESLNELRSLTFKQGQWQQFLLG